MITIPAAPTATDPTLCILELRTRRRDTVLVDLVELAYGVGAVREPAPVVELLKCRERAGTTALGKGVAMPHARSLFVTRPILVVARSSRGVDWCEDGEPVRLVLLALGPAEISDAVWHLRLARISALGRLQKHRQRLLGAADSGSMLALARETGAMS